MHLAALVVPLDRIKSMNCIRLNTISNHLSVLISTVVRYDDDTCLDIIHAAGFWVIIVKIFDANIFNSLT